MLPGRGPGQLAQWEQIDDGSTLIAAKRIAGAKAVLSGILGGCVYCIWSFCTYASRRRSPATDFWGVVQWRRAFAAAGLCTGMSSTSSWLHFREQRRQAAALERLQQNAEAVHLAPIGGGSGAAPLPEEEFNAATGQNAKAANDELMEKVLGRQGRFKH
eukprot:gnl/MRDRNA2_/MRDRNA2_190982_c0_seq1.p1 gnl/MRDRNA2_/MRDRNA2_190982_c0~~gnl/MRDRNA2_/MRDRNA2_190982_c0_seq1.p1  ORF type:complete len:174 (+),score=48.40 gnl/MRDRNA2_/MRDRNA2_190982_c0_seq1:47-523(+)